MARKTYTNAASGLRPPEAIELRRERVIQAERQAEERLTKFRDHKEELLSHLRNAYECDPKHQLFSEDRAWAAIKSLAYTQYRNYWLKQRTMSAAEREARLSELAKRMA